jgi:NTE family protein
MELAMLTSDDNQSVSTGAQNGVSTSNSAVTDRLAAATSPVTETEEVDTSQPEQGIALCLSGGGYRAMLFHVGTLYRLNEAGLLPQLSRISSVSGGSITAGVLGLKWSQLTFNNEVATNFEAEVVRPIRGLASKTIDAISIIGGVLLPGSVADKVAGSYRRFLFGNHTLQDLPDSPIFVINATNVQSGALWRFRKAFMGDYRVGLIDSPTTELAVAVAASSAFPPVLSPLLLELKDDDFRPNSGLNLQRPPFTTDVLLTDGGVYDNLGLETAWKNYTTIFVSDGGGKMGPEEEPEHDWARHAIRVIELTDNQVRSLRKRQLLHSFVSNQREGAYWGIMTEYAKYGRRSKLDCPFDATTKLANIATRLQRLDDRTQECIINWGYAVCDAALRTHYDDKLPEPAQFIYPNSGVKL